VRWTTIRPWLGSVARLVLGVVWIWAGWSKIRDPLRSVQAVRAYDATPEWLSKAIGYGLPVLELCIGALLIAGVIVRLAAIVSTTLLTVFVIGTLQAAARGIKLECGCFGGGGTTASTTYILDVLRDVGLLALAVYLVVWPLTRWSVDEYLARNDFVAPPSAKRMRTGQGARKYNAMLEARRKAARERTLYLSAALSVLIVLISIVGIGVQANRAKIQGDLTGTNATVADGVTVGKAAKVTVDFFEDFQCPTCNTLEQSVGSDVAAQIAAGRIQAKYHMMSFLDSASNGNRYSSRAANAALCASDVSVADFQKFHAILYGKDSKGQNNQPAENSNGRTDAQLLDYGKQAGIKGDDLTTFQSCVTGQLHKALVSAITDNASRRGVNATPTVFVNGKQLKTANKASLDTAIAAIAGPPSNTTSPTPSSSASKSVAP
jgi:protein-disulfide isomerase/uncharacterized membrane protein YphA (DoxX/SURF4 family)